MAANVLADRVTIARRVENCVDATIAVVVAPGGDERTCMCHRWTPALLEGLIAESPTRTLDARIFGRLAGTNGMDAHAALVRPTVERACDALATRTCVDFDRSRILCAVVDEVEHHEILRAVQAIHVLATHSEALALKKYVKPSLPKARALGCECER